MEDTDDLLYEERSRSDLIPIEKQANEYQRRSTPTK